MTIEDLRLLAESMKMRSAVLSERDSADDHSRFCQKKYRLKTEAKLRHKTNDKLRELLEEIYYEGYQDGYNHLKGIIAMHNPRIFVCHSDKFTEKNMEIIRRRVDAIREAEGSDDP